MPTPAPLDPLPRLVVFDMDGTLCDTTQIIVDTWHATLIECGFGSPGHDAIRHYVGSAIKASFPALRPDSAPGDIDVFMSHYRDNYIAAVTRSHPPLFLGVREILDRLFEAGTLLGVATSKSRVGLDRTLDALDLRRYFVAFATADQAPSKPHPQMMLDLLRDTRTDPQDAIMIGDTTFDLEMAHHAGVRAVGVTWGAHSRETLVKVKPFAVVDGLSDLLRERGPPSPR
ncbi:MAG: HAD family hydrolase [Planctomycetes bacterium]|nr:HAD family hydrolase [Planctomycetota bacterium]